MEGCRYNQRLLAGFDWKREMLPISGAPVSKLPLKSSLEIESLRTPPNEGRLYFYAYEYRWISTYLLALCWIGVFKALFESQLCAGDRAFRGQSSKANMTVLASTT